MVTNTVTELANQAIAVRNTAPPHLLEGNTTTCAEIDDGPPDLAHDHIGPEKSGRILG